MRRNIFIFLLLGLFSVSAFAQKKSAVSRVEVDFARFKTDGCSLFPDGKYRNCCVAHDRAYFGGGSWTARWRADKELYKCVAATKGFQHKLIAPVMWLGVRAGGLHFLPTPFRWGFGRRKIKTKSPDWPVVNSSSNQQIQ